MHLEFFFLDIYVSLLILCIFTFGLYPVSYCLCVWFHVDLYIYMLTCTHAHSYIHAYISKRNVYIECIDILSFSENGNTFT